jgi:hypothetical protein
VITKEWFIAWGSGPGDDVKTYDVTSYGEGIARLDTIQAAKRVKRPDGTYVVRFPEIRWSSILRNTPKNRKVLGIHA